MKNRILLILILIFLPSTMFSGERSPYFSNKQWASFILNYDIGVMNFGSGDESVRFGGWFGFNLKANTKLINYKNVNLFIRGDFTYNSMSYSNEDLESGGINETASLINYGLCSSIMIQNYEIFYGYRKYSGKNNKSYDWWSDYTSSIAWKGQYADYYWNEKNKMNLVGNEIGIRYHYFVKADPKRIFSEKADVIFQFKLLRVDMIIEHVNFWFLSVFRQPFWGNDGLSSYMEIGYCRSLKAFEVRGGIGYLFSLH